MRWFIICEEKRNLLRTYEERASEKCMEETLSLTDILPSFPFSSL